MCAESSTGNTPNSPHFFRPICPNWPIIWDIFEDSSYYISIVPVHIHCFGVHVVVGPVIYLLTHQQQKKYLYDEKRGKGMYNRMSTMKPIVQAENQHRQGATKKKSIRLILFLYFEESLVSSNLNSKQLRFHGAHPNVQSSPATGVIPFILNLGTNAWFTSQKNRKKSCIKKRIEKKR